MTEATVSSLIKDGILIEVLHEGAQKTHPGLYQHAVASGGAFAARLQTPMSEESLAVKDQQIILVMEFMEKLTPEEQEAIIVHEMTHIKEDHLLHNPHGKTISMNVLEHELQADAAAVSAVGAAAMLSAVEKLSTMTFQHALKTERTRLAKFLAYMTRTKVLRKRIKVLKALVRKEQAAGK